MSYGVSPIAVSLAEVEAMIESHGSSTGFFSRLFGSSTDRLIKAIRRKFSYRFEEDEVFDEDEPTLDVVLAELLGGIQLHHDYGHKYAYALELLCLHFGEQMDNSAWSAMHLDWFDHVYHSLQSSGVCRDGIDLVRKLFERGSPVCIPPPDDFPGIGYLRINEIQRALDYLNGAKIEKIDDEVHESVAQMKQWFDFCLDRDCDFVCFYY